MLRQHQPVASAIVSTTLRAFSVLEYVVGASVPVSLEDATQGCGLPKPTVYRILGTLSRAGLIEREPVSKRYGIGRRLSGLAVEVLRNVPLHSVRHNILRKLVDEIGETCNFTILDGNAAVWLDRVETSSPIRLHLEPGTRVPLHCTASGKLFASQLHPTRLAALLGRGPLQRYTARTIIDPVELQRQLKRIRNDGYSADYGEFLEGSVAIAVPVLDRKDRMVAALSAHGPYPRMTVPKGLQYLPALRKAAKEIAASMSTDAHESGNEIHSIRRNTR